MERCGQTIHRNLILVVSALHKRNAEPAVFLSLWLYFTHFSVLRIRDVYPGSEFFPIPDPGSASKNLDILTQKIVSNLSEIWSKIFIRDPDPDLGFYSSRIQDQKGKTQYLFFTKICGAGEIPQYVDLLANPRLPHPRVRPGAPCYAGLGRVSGHERPEVLLQPAHPREELETPAEQVKASLNVVSRTV